jgi:hypothetical protein
VHGKRNHEYGQLYWDDNRRGGQHKRDVSLTVNATADLTCTNRGGNLVEPHSSTVTDTTTALERPNRNGQIVLDPISEQITEADVEAAFTCPNRNWTEDVQDITITSFSYTVTFAGFSAPAITVTG